MADAQVAPRIKKLRASHAGLLTRQCNKALEAIEIGRSKATLRDLFDNISSALDTLKGTHELYLSLLSQEDVAESELWLKKRVDTANSVLENLLTRMKSSDVKSYTTATSETSSISSFKDLDHELAKLEQLQIQFNISQKHVQVQENANISKLRDEVRESKIKQERVEEWLNTSTVVKPKVINKRLSDKPTLLKITDKVLHDAKPKGAAKFPADVRPKVVKSPANAPPADVRPKVVKSLADAPPLDHMITNTRHAEIYPQPDTPDNSNLALVKATDSRLNPDAPTWEPQPPIDAWIDQLISGQETVIQQQTSRPTKHENRMMDALLKLESDRGLPPAEIPVFDGSPLLWPKFIEQFYTQVHTKPGITDARRMDLLQSHVKDDAKVMIRGIGYSGRCYADALKELKKTFGHRNQVALAYLHQITRDGTRLPSGNAVLLRQFYVDIRDCIITLNQLGHTTDMLGTDLLMRVAQRIPLDRIKFWNRHVTRISRSREPSIHDLRNWLAECVETEYNPYAVKLESGKGKLSKTSSGTKGAISYNTATHKTKDNSNKVEKRLSSSVKERKSLPSSKNKDGVICPLCNESHYLHRCFRFVNRRPEERLQFVKSHKLCQNCLRSNHELDKCLSNLRCREPGCNQNHHTLLHNEEKVSVRNASVHVASKGCNPSRTCFQLVRIYACGSNGLWIPTVALLDSASEITVLHKSLAMDLGLKGKSRQLTIKTMNAESTVKTQVVSLQLKAADETGSECMYVKDAWIVDTGAFQCPPQQILSTWEHVKGLGLSDIDSSEVQMLIGINVPAAHLQVESKIGDSNQPIAVRTPLGWTLMGIGKAQQLESVIAKVNLILSQDQQLHHDVEKFWKTESFGVKCENDKSLSVEDKKAQKILEDTTRLVDGHYEVGMLWRDQSVTLPDNKHIASRRYHLLDKRLKRNVEMKHLYSETLEGYISKGYARKLSPHEAEQKSSKTWYIPHHAVENPNKPGKVRVVFDAAATCQGTSLNDSLMTGPDLLSSLFGVIQRFRLYRVALCADIEGMFHQVRVPPIDSDALRFIWNDSIYKMDVHIFGAKDSPTCANYALKRAALDNADKYSKEAVQTILREFYVDDLAKSVDTVSTAVELAKDVTNMLKEGGFRLHKWVSNSLDVLKHIEKSERTIQELEFAANETNVHRTLGLKWKIDEDILVFQSNIKDAPMTKRGVISIMSQIFDPCGYLAPFIFRAKLFVQELWRVGISWDEPLNEELQHKWKAWLKELEDLSNFRLPRHHLEFTPTAEHVQLHIFSDASESGFGAVAYLRFNSGEGRIGCSLLAAKTAIAPIKTALSIPRLELQGAVMASRLGNTLKKELNLAIADTWYWTDSTTVLCYLNNETTRFKSFVANRISEILETTESTQWHYISTRLNPADCCSRGLKASVLCCHDQWYEGPGFLHSDEENWPTLQDACQTVDISEDNPEVKKTQAVYNVAVARKPVNVDVTKLIDLTHFSSWQRLVRKTAMLKRAICNFMSPIQRFGLKVTKSASITASEFLEAELEWIRAAQLERFLEETVSLRTQQPVDQKSKIASLMPYLDEDSNCLRVGGRLRKANIPVETKHQLILPADHHVTLLLFEHTHRRNAHCGREHLVASMKEKYWPVRARNLAKSTIRGCLLCKLRRLKLAVPVMSDLPEFRLSVSSGAFHHTGLDYFGPINVKVRRTTVKRWGCLFTCLSTRAVHLELADSLETDDFLLCLRRFIGRRGQPKTIHSDNGTNFRGAVNELKQCLQNLSQSKIQEFLSPQGVEWYFNPPATPHMGGVWESLVKSVKRALNAVLPKQNIVESVLRTALVEVEAVINSRPLTHNSDDPADYTALTPNHFLIGRAVNVGPPDVVSDRELSSRKRWRRVQVVANHVCKRWLREYLPTLTVRRKWLKEQRNVAEGDLVIIHDDKLPRGSWELARVIETYPGDDGRIRTVRLKTAKTSYIRPVAGISVLEENVNL